MDTGKKIVKEKIFLCFPTKKNNIFSFSVFYLFPFILFSNLSSVFFSLSFQCFFFIISSSTKKYHFKQRGKRFHFCWASTEKGCDVGEFYQGAWRETENAFFKMQIRLYFCFLLFSFLSFSFSFFSLSSSHSLCKIHSLFEIDLLVAWVLESQNQLETFEKLSLPLSYRIRVTCIVAVECIVTRYRIIILSLFFAWKNWKCLRLLSVCFSFQLSLFSL